VLPAVPRPADAAWVRVVVIGELRYWPFGYRDEIHL